MTRPSAVIDTNVVVTGLLTRDPSAPTARILDAMLAGDIRIVVSVALLAEYRSVLLRPKVARHHHLDEAEVDTLLHELARVAVERSPRPLPARERGPDPGDAHVWALLRASPESVLVTGDRALLDAPPRWARVVSPRDFAERLEE